MLHGSFSEFLRHKFIVILKPYAHSLEIETPPEFLAEHLYFNMVQPAFRLYFVGNFDGILENADGLLEYLKKQKNLKKIKGTVYHL